MSLFSSLVGVACLTFASATYYGSPAPYYGSPAPYYLNRFDGAGVYGGGLSGPATGPLGVPFGYYGGAPTAWAQRVPVPIAYPSAASSPLGAPPATSLLNQQALSQLIASLNTQSQLSDSSFSATEPLVLYEDKNAEVAQGRRPSNVRGNIVARPLIKLRTKKPGNLGYVLALPNKKTKNGASKQVWIQNGPNGPTIGVGGGPAASNSGLQALLNLFRQNGNIPGGNGVVVLIPQNQLNQLQSQSQQNQFLSQGQQQTQGSKQPTPQYTSTFLPPGIEVVNGEGYPLEVAPEEDVLEEQLPNSGTVNTSYEEDLEANNDILPLAVGEDDPEAVLEVGTKGISKFGYHRRPGGLYLIPNKVRYSKAMADDQDHSTTTTQPISHSEESH